jgi:hypothetical protein
MEFTGDPLPRFLRRKKENSYKKPEWMQRKPEWMPETWENRGVRLLKPGSSQGCRVETWGFGWVL